MGPLFFLAGSLFVMMSYIWIVGVVLKKDLILGIIAMVTFPVFSIYWTFYRDYQNTKKPFAAGILGFTCLIVGKAIGW
jgi:hypothetical protein